MHHNTSCKRMRSDIRHAAEPHEIESATRSVIPSFDYKPHGPIRSPFLRSSLLCGCWIHWCVCWQLCMCYICICCDYQLTFVPGKGSPRRMAKLVSEVGFQNSSNRSGHMISNYIGIYPPARLFGNLNSCWLHSPRNTSNSGIT